MITILKKITDIIETYESGAYKDLYVMHGIENIDKDDN